MNGLSRHADGRSGGTGTAFDATIILVQVPYGSTRPLRISETGFAYVDVMRVHVERSSLLLPGTVHAY